MAKKKKHEAAASPSFEEALSQLEAIVEHLEEGNVGLAESLKLYEQGAALLKQGHQLLAEAEQRIEQVSGKDADGNPALEPFARTPEGAPRQDIAQKSPGGAGETPAADEGASDEQELF